MVNHNNLSKHMKLKWNGEEFEVDGTITSFQLFQDNRLYTGHYNNMREIPEIKGLYWAFWENREDLLKLYDGVSGTALITSLYRYMRESRLPSRFVFAYSLYYAGCNHSRKDIRGMDITSCECYETAYKIHKKALFFKRIRTNEIMVLGNDNKSQIEKLEIAS